MVVRCHDEPMRRIVLAIAVVLAACGGDTSTRDDGTRAGTQPATTASDVTAFRGDLTVEVLREIPHDPEAFTQGLEFFDGRLLESTGRSSTLRELDPHTGAVLTSIPLEPPLFGEGLTVVDDEIVQLTWRAGRALRWDVVTLEPVGEFSYEGEGWGLCLDGAELVMSDGTATLTRRDPATFAATGSVEVHRDGEPVELLNELECVDGTILANVWRSDEVLAIDPRSGEVTAVIDATVLRERADPAESDDVLNGIADLGDGTYLFGGKNWDRHFVVRVVPR